MGNPFKKPKAPPPPPKIPEPPPPAPIPTADDPQLKINARKTSANRSRRSGRVSTILSQGSESLG